MFCFGNGQVYMATPPCYLHYKTQNPDVCIIHFSGKIFNRFMVNRITRYQMRNNNQQLAISNHRTFCTGKPLFHFPTPTIKPFSFNGKVPHVGSREIYATKSSIEMAAQRLVTKATVTSSCYQAILFTVCNTDFLVHPSYA